MILNIRKRDGRLVPFEVDKIAGAIYKAFQACDKKYELKTALEVADVVEKRLEEKQSLLPTVELVQDTVEEVLIELGYVRVAKAYILYRAKRTHARDVKAAVMNSLEQQDDDKINIFETLESLMNDVKEKTRKEDIKAVFSMLKDMDLNDQEIAEKLSEAFSISKDKALDFIAQ